VRYTPSGGRVDLRLRQEGNAAVFEVQDTGPGIAPEDIERVFSPFVRLPGAAGEGSGLGLSIARQIAQRLGGEVTLGNAPAGGLILRYRQPIQKVNESSSGLK